MLTREEREFIRNALKFANSAVEATAKFQRVKNNIENTFDILDHYEDEVIEEIERRAADREREAAWGDDV